VVGVSKHVDGEKALASARKVEDKDAIVVVLEK